MSPSRALPILAVSLSYLLLAASAQAQFPAGPRPNRAPDSLLASQNDLLIVVPPHAASSPLQPLSPYHDAPKARPALGKSFWLGWGLAGALSIVSVETTAHCERIPGCSEGNPLFGKQPTRLELYAPRAAVIAAGMLFARHWKRRHPSDDTPALTVLAIDAIWGADAAWDVHQLVAAREPRPKSLTATPR